MTEMPPMIRQGQLIEESARGIAQGVTGEWTKLEYHVRALAPFREDGLTRTKADGTPEKVRIPRSVSLDAVKELRSVMYRPGYGTWYSFVLTITQPGDVDVKFDYTDEPDWNDPVSPLFYSADQEMFPRDEASQPEWLKKQLALAAAQD